MATGILTIKSDGDRVKFMRGALLAICEHLEEGCTDSAQSIAMTCLIGIEHGTDSPEFVARVAIEMARLKEQPKGVS